MSTVTIKAADGGAFSAYIALPKDLNTDSVQQAPGLILIQEIFGVNHVMRDVADGYAKQGFITICPDLFWRLEPNVQLTDQTEEDWAKAFQLFKDFDVDQGVKDLEATLSYLRDHAAVTDKVGAVGYCLGGLLAYLTALRTDIDASVAYYGVQIEANLEESQNISTPLLMHVAEKDQFVSPEAQKEIVEKLSPHEPVSLHLYAGQDHAFARVGGQHYDADAAERANERTHHFLHQHLGPVDTKNTDQTKI